MLIQEFALKTPGRAMLVVVAAALVAACGGGAATPSAVPTPTPTPSPTPTPAPTARYSVTFEATWSAQTHPTDAPPNPHFSGLIGATHRDAVRFWETGQLASDGIEAMAEEGAKSPLDQEVQAAITAGTAQHLLSGGGIGLSPGSVSLEFEISSGFPLVTLVSMLAPSPDWFVGVTALSLLEDNAWVDERTIDLHPYDAGTDSGVSFRSPNRTTTPREAITEIDSGPLVVAGSVSPVGRFVFRRQS
jgi:hypothetical protein